MEIITGLIGFFTNKENIESIFAGIGGLYVFLLMIVKLTPTPADDEILAKVWAVVGKFTGIKK